MMIDPDTFEINGAFSTHTLPSGRVLVTIYGTVMLNLEIGSRRVPASRTDDTIVAHGITGRYRTGTKAWPALVRRYPLPFDPSQIVEHISFGFDSHSGKHRKVSISWA